VPHTLFLDALRLNLSTPPRHFGQIESFCSQARVDLFTSKAYPLFPPNFGFDTNFSSRHAQKTQICHIQITKEREKQNVVRYVPGPVQETLQILRSKHMKEKSS
jgi:hypothetical protein